MLLMYQAIKLFGTMPLEVLNQGMGTLTGLLIGLGVFVFAIQKANMKGVASSLMALSISLAMLILPIKILGEMDPNVLAAGMEALKKLLVGIGIFMGALAIIQGIGGSLAGVAAGLLALSVALLILTVPIRILGALPWQVVALGIVAVLAPLALFVAAAWALAPLSPVLLTIAGTLLMFGAATLAIGAGLVLLGTGFAQLALIGAVGAAAIVATLATILIGIAAAVPQAAQAFAAGMLTAIPTMQAALQTLLLALLQTLQSVSPALMETIAILLEAALQTIIDYGPSIAQKFLELGGMIVVGLAKGLWSGVVALVNLLNDLGWVIIDAFKAILGINSPSTVFADLGGYIISGLIEGLTNGIKGIVTTVTNLGQTILDTFRNFMGIHSNAETTTRDGEYITGGYVDGIENKLPEVKDAAIKVGETALGGLGGYIKKAWDAGGLFTENFAAGVGKSITKMDRLISGDMEMVEPTIKPVIDMSNVEAGINSAFNKDRTLNVDGLNSKTSNIATLDQNRRAAKDLGLIGFENDTTNSTFNIVINNPVPEASGESVRKVLIKHSYGIA